MSTHQERLDAYVAEMRDMGTEELLEKHIPEILRIAKSADPNNPRLAVLSYILENRGVVARPPERDSERAMRLASYELGEASWWTRVPLDVLKVAMRKAGFSAGLSRADTNVFMAGMDQHNHDRIIEFIRSEGTDGQ